MKLHNDTAEIFVPDGVPVEEALARTTHMGICAHQDDLEIMAYDGILQCFQQKDRWFAGIVVTDGAGSPRDDLYGDYTDEMMREVRRQEQKKAAYVGEYAAVALLDYPSKAVKTPPGAGPRDDIAALLTAARPETVYVHNLADKHDTHVAVALRTITAIRSLPEDARPKRLYGVEVWRDLDWMVDSDKVALDLSPHENLQAALVGVFDSQICGGKRYDLATQGRRRAHATYHASHGTDESTSLAYAMDLTPLVTDTGLDPWAHVAGHLERLTTEIQGRLAALQGGRRTPVSLKDEIHEQPAVLSRILQSQAAPIRRIAAELHQQQIHSVLLAARGTSDNAGIYAKYLWGAYNRLPVAMAAPSLYSCYKKLPAFKDTLVVAISQSGESPDIVGVVEEGYRQGAPTLVITNAVNSPLARAAHAAIDLCAGEEKAVAATKTYTAELMAIAMLSAALDGDEERWRALDKVPGIVSQTLALDETIRQRAERYRFMDHCVVLGRGFNYATAFEWALKLKELAYVIADPYSSADFQHGPVAMLERDFPVLALAPDGPVFDDTLALLSRLRKEQNVELLVISDRDEALALAHTPLRLPAGLPEWLTPISAIAAAQLFCYHVTRAKGLDTESPRGLRKVTLTN